MRVRALLAGLFGHKVTRFFIVGSLATAVYYVVFIPLVEWNNVPYGLGATLAFVPSVALNFAMQKWWAFRDSDRERAHIQLAQFLLKTLLFYFLTLILLYVGVEYMDLRPLFAQVVATALLTYFAYYVYDRWIFNV